MLYHLALINCSLFARKHESDRFTFTIPSLHVVFNSSLHPEKVFAHHRHAKVKTLEAQRAIYICIPQIVCL